MGFSTRPRGLDYVGTVNQLEHGDVNDWAAAGSPYNCLSIDPETLELVPIIDCASNTEATDSISVSPASLAAFLPAEYYAMHVQFLGPQGYQPGDEACEDFAGGPPTGGPERCGPPQQVIQFTTITGDYVSATLDAASAPSDATTVPQVPVNGDAGQENFELGRTGIPFDDVQHGQPTFLVNPSPVWPFPDSRGNLFGMCIFEPGQLPAAITATVTAQNIGLGNPEDWGGGRLRVYLLGYDGDETAEGDVFYSTIVGAV